MITSLPLFLYLSGVIPSVSPANGDSTAIVELLKDDYRTMVTNDINRHRSNCTADYILIENGEFWDMEREAASYKANEKRIIQRTDHFDFKYISLDGNTAYAVYDLKSDIVEKGVTTRKHWSESVVFRKTDGQWKIALIHSTPVKN